MMIDNQVKIYEAYFFPPTEQSEKTPNEKFKETYVFAKDKEGARAYLDQVDVNYDDGFFLAEAVKRGDLDIVEALLKQQPKSEFIFDALSEAVYYGRIGCIEELIKHVEHVEDALLEKALLHRGNPLVREYFATHPRTKVLFEKRQEGLKAAASKGFALKVVPTSFSPTVSSGENHKNAQTLATNKTENKQSILTHQEGIKPIFSKKETLEEVSETMTAEIHKLTEKSNLSSEECRKIQDLSRTLVELKHVKNKDFILKEIYKDDSGIGEVEHFVINLEAINEGAMYPLPLDKLHYVEEKVFEQAISELARQFSTENPINEEFAPNAVVVKFFARQDGAVKINPTTNLPKWHSIVLWKNKDEIALIDPTTSKFGQHIIEFLNLRFKSFRFALYLLGAKYASPEKNIEGIANDIALEINCRKDVNISTPDAMASIKKIFNKHTSLKVPTHKNNPSIRREENEVLKVIPGSFFNMPTLIRVVQGDYMPNKKRNNLKGKTYTFREFLEKTPTNRSAFFIENKIQPQIVGATKSEEMKNVIPKGKEKV
jgi:hypothetical protein